MSDLSTKIDRITPELVAMAAWQTGMPLAYNSWGYYGECGCPLAQIIIADNGPVLQREEHANGLQSSDSLGWMAAMIVVNDDYDLGFIYGVDGKRLHELEEANHRPEARRGYADGQVVRMTLPETYVTA